MRLELTPSAQVLVCGACEGMWIDWFEGEVQAVAVAHEAARVERGAPPPRRPGQAPSGRSVCPRCQCGLASELSRFPDASADDLITGVDLLRCAECAGAFVPRGSAHLLLDRVRETRTQGPWDALVALVQRVFVRP